MGKKSKGDYLSCQLLLGGFILASFSWLLPANASTEKNSPIWEIEKPSSSHKEQVTSLRSSTEETHLILSLSDRQVSVRQDDEVIATYPVAVGRGGWETPTGEFEVRQMVKNPAWQNPWTEEVIPPGEENPLGKRWIGFWTDGINTIGFHGTPDESVMGEAVSHGCVRMRNEDISKMFEKVTVGTKVIVQN
ncbi:MAG: L,D-transpeptidase [Cyanobacteriota bacterium]